MSHRRPGGRYSPAKRRAICRPLAFVLYRRYHAVHGLPRPSSSPVNNHPEIPRLKKFLRKLEHVQSNADVKLLLSECPEPNAPGRRFYSNLAFFIEHLVPPRSAGISETMLYVKLAERLRPLVAKQVMTHEHEWWRL